MVVILRPEEWESKFALSEGVAGANVISIGLESQSPIKFYSFPLVSEGIPSTVAVWSSGHGTIPLLAIFSSDVALVGSDCKLTWIDLKSRTARGSLVLGGVFLEFAVLEGSGDMLVFHELGVLRATAAQAVIWSVDTCVLVNWRLESGHVVLSEMDRLGSSRIDLDSGRVERVAGEA